MMDRVGSTVAVAGALVALYSAWHVAKGPFFGHPVPPRWTLLLACGTFVLGLIVLAWGINVLAGARSGERPDISEHHDHTMDWIRR